MRPLWPRLTRLGSFWKQSGTLGAAVPLTTIRSSLCMRRQSLSSAATLSSAGFDDDDDDDEGSS